MNCFFVDNFIDIDSDFLSFKATYDLGDHVLSAGIDRDESAVYNLFIARYNGEVQFDSIADFEAGTYSYLRFHTPQTGIADVDRVAANFDIEKTTLYVQDRIYLGDLTLDVGLRYDQVETPTLPVANPKFEERNGKMGDSNSISNTSSVKFNNNNYLNDLLL